MSLIAEARRLVADWSQGPGETREMIERLVEALVTNEKRLEDAASDLRRASGDAREWREWREQVWRECPHEYTTMGHPCRVCGAVIPVDDATEITEGLPRYVQYPEYYAAAAERAS